MLVGAVNDELEVLGQLVQTARNIAQVDDDLGFIGSDSLHQRGNIFIRLLQGIDSSAGRLQEVMPVIRLAQLGANPQICAVVTTAGATAELTHAVKHLGECHARACDRRRRLRGEPQIKRGAFGCRQITRYLAQCTGARPAKALK